jgi:hypothetical protein
MRMTASNSNDSSTRPARRDMKWQARQSMCDANAIERNSGWEMRKRAPAEDQPPTQDGPSQDSPGSHSSSSFTD